MFQLSTMTLLLLSTRNPAIYAAFHLFKFRQEEITGVHDVNVLSAISNYT